MATMIAGHLDRYPTYAALRNRIEHDSFMATSGPAPMINNTEIPETEDAAYEEGDSLTEAINALNKVIKGKLTHLRLNSCFTLLCCVLASTKSDAAQLYKKTKNN